MAGPEGGTEGQTNIQTDIKSPHSTGLCPLLGLLPCFPHENQGESRAGQGNRWPFDAFGLLLNLFVMIWGNISQVWFQHLIFGHFGQFWEKLMTLVLWQYRLIPNCSGYWAKSATPRCARVALFGWKYKREFTYIIYFHCRWDSICYKSKWNQHEFFCIYIHCCVFQINKQYISRIIPHKFLS